MSIADAAIPALADSHHSATPGDTSGPHAPHAETPPSDLPKPGDKFGFLEFQRVATVEERFRKNEPCWVLDCKRCRRRGVIKPAWGVRNGRVKSCGCYHADGYQPIERPSAPDRLLFGQVRRLTGIRERAWRRLMDKGVAPRPVTTSPTEEWNARDISNFLAWRKGRPALAEVEALGQKISIRNCGASADFVATAIRNGDLDENDITKEWVKVPRGRFLVLCEVTFIHKAAIDLLRICETGKRSESARKWWDARETIRLGRDLLLLPSVARRHLGVSMPQLLKIAKKHGLSVSWRDKSGNEVLDPVDGKSTAVGDGAFKYYYLSELNRYLRERNALAIDKALKEAMACSVRDTSRRTGVPLRRLESVTESAKLGLERTTVTAVVQCVRKYGKDGNRRRRGSFRRIDRDRRDVVATEKPAHRAGKQKWTQTVHITAFTELSVREYMQNENVMGLVLGAAFVTREQAAEELGVSVDTIQYWWREFGILVGEEKEYWTPAGERKGLVVTRTSIADAKKVLGETKGDVKKACIILRVRAARDAGKWPEKLLCSIEAQRACGVTDQQLKYWRRTGRLNPESVPESDDKQTGKRFPGGWAYDPEETKKAKALDGRSREARAHRTGLTANDGPLGGDGATMTPPTGAGNASAGHTGETLEGFLSPVQPAGAGDQQPADTAATATSNTVKYPDLGIEVNFDRKRVIAHGATVDLERSAVQWHIFRVALEAFPEACSVEAMEADYPGEVNDVARQVATMHLNKKLYRVKLKIFHRRLGIVSD